MTTALEIREDAAFNREVLAEARGRINRAHGRQAARLERRALRAVCSKRVAVTAAATAFGIGMAWPVCDSPPGGPALPAGSRLVRAFAGDVVASLDRAGG